ncbi:MAG: hypothetical protein KAV48_03750 [Methanomicrobia archaeon]|nr:hypothetical protein [Methanomicrobia archaeon]MCK4309896.1 hypothetical protein [Methanomicrobia archaeon]MCK4433028.1 hypothetical protein [Methanomicrobia archaeon]MCK4636916.1 hypothetical protein [Methanomicrobia archaeon]
MKPITESKNFLYLLTICVVVSLILNVSLIYTLYSTKENVFSGMEEFSDELRDLKDEKMSFVIPIDTTVTVPIKETVVVDIPYYGKLAIPFEANLNVPIKIEVKIEKTLEEIGLGDLIDRIIELIQEYSKL